MNKKKLITILTLVVLLTAVFAMIFTGCGKKKPQDEPVEPTTSQTEAPEVPGNTEETEEPTRETIPGEPDPYGESDEVTQKPTEETEPSEPATEPEEEDATENTQQPTEPEATQQPTTGTTNIPTAGGTAYESYIAMSGEQQQAFIDQFASVAEFVNWYNAAKAEYDAARPDIEIGGDTVVDGSQLGKN